MAESYNPARDPMNGPNRLALDRTPEAREYDSRDWPGSSSFHPPHLRDVLREVVVTEEIKTDDDPQTPEE